MNYIERLQLSFSNKHFKNIILIVCFKKMVTETLVQESEHTPNNEEDLLRKFKCSKCYVLVDDLKILKSHLWDYHLSRIEKIEQSNQKLNSVERNKKSRKLEKDDETPKKKRKLDYNPKDVDESDGEEALDETLESTNTEKEKKIIEKLSENDYKIFNFENIDENKVLERAQDYYPLKNFDKVTELKKSRFGWAQWRSRGVTIMWPCIFEKYAKDSSNTMKVFFRYYEINNQKGKVFRTPLSKVEFFFKSTEHFDTKVHFKI